LGLPAAYFFTVLLNQILTPLNGSLLRHLRNRANLPDLEILPVPLGILLIAFLIYWVLSDINLPLLARQFWTSTASILVNDKAEHSIRHRLVRSRNMGAASVIRLARGVLDVLVIFVGLVFGLYHFGLNSTAALAGLGVGGIAVALAAQKTLENVLGGISIHLRPGSRDRRHAADRRHARHRRRHRLAVHADSDSRPDVGQGPQWSGR
jgi:MscS family membrane protein